MHGEYKVPGGKLVTVDLDVADGALRNVRVAGDFFLEPDEALAAIDAALEGAPSDAGVPVLAARIQAALPEGAVMVGFTAEAVGTAVRRAVARATGWTDYDWRLIHEGPQPPALHMALDQVLTEQVALGLRPPTLRVWEWASPAVVIGSFQSLRNEVDPEGAARHGVTVVRRISGGGAMFVEPGNTITYSLYVPDSLVAGLSFADSYAYLDDWVLAALGDMGITAWYQPLNDIATEAGKIAGAAQKRMVAGSGTARGAGPWTAEAGGPERAEGAADPAEPDAVPDAARARDAAGARGPAAAGAGGGGATADAGDAGSTRATADAAGRPSRGAVLHHVTMAYDIDAAAMTEVLRIGREKLSDKGTGSARKRVDPLRRQTGLSRTAVIDRMIASFRQRYGLADGRVTDQEAARARQLAEEKFSSPQWTARVP